jgi:hypothetical protein
LLPGSSLRCCFASQFNRVESNDCVHRFTA